MDALLWAQERCLDYTGPQCLACWAALWTGRVEPSQVSLSCPGWGQLEGPTERKRQALPHRDAEWLQSANYPPSLLFCASILDKYFVCICWRNENRREGRQGPAKQSVWMWNARGLAGAWSVWEVNPFISSKVGNAEKWYLSNICSAYCVSLCVPRCAGFRRKLITVS